MFSTVCPLVSEYVWQQLRKEKIVSEESIHLCEWPEYDEKKIDKKIEGEFEIALKVIESGLAERDKAQIGLKWPLARAELFLPKDKEILNELLEIISNQLNVKKIEVKKGKEKEISVKLDTKMTPELEAEGYAREISRKVQALRKTTGLVKENVIELVLVASEKLGKMLGSHKNMIAERTNSKSLSIGTKKPGKKFKASAEDKIKEEKVEIYFSQV